MSISKYFAPVKKISSQINPPLEKRPNTEAPVQFSKELKGSSSKYFEKKEKKEKSESDSDTEVLEEPEEPRTIKKTQPVPQVEHPIVKPQRANPGKPKPKPEKSTPPNPSPPNPKDQVSKLSMENKSFVITGLLHDFSRESLTDRLKELGGKVTATVSKKTAYLIHGYKLEDGRDYKQGNKYKKALELGTKILDEEGIKAFLLTQAPNDQPESPEPPTEPMPRLKPARAEKFQSPSQSSNPGLWTDKYRPTSLSDLIGNAQIIERLQNWLSTWDDEILTQGSQDKQAKTKSTENTKAKAVLLSGPPGIGKTTAARLVALESGYRVMELNASDTRSKKVVNELLTSSSKSHCLTFTGNIVKNLIIMDEVDGMSAGDRGGTAALIQVIKTSKNPIICICNDRQSAKLKSLANYCYDLRFSKPNKLQITRRVLQILKAEGMSCEPNAVEFLVESSGNDIRQILTALDLWSRSYNEMTYMQARNSMKVLSKDSTCMVDHFDAASKFFNSSEMKKRTHKEKIDLAFIDYDLIPLIVHENYLSAMGSDLGALSEAADSLVLSDLLSNEIYKNGKWGLLPSYLQASCVHPTSLCSKLVPFAKFPEFFGKSSTLRKNERLVREVQGLLGPFASCGSEGIVNEYVPMIHDLIVNDLENDDFEEAAKTLFNLKLTIEKFKENVLGLLLTEDKFKNLSAGIKKKFTVFYNKEFGNSIERTKVKKEVSLAKDKFDPDYQEIDPEELEVEEAGEVEEIGVKPVLLTKGKR